MGQRLVMGAVGLAVLWTATSPAYATPQLFGQAKGAGMPVKNCQYCHTDAIPKKDTFKPDELNERGKWLLTEKDKTKSPDIRVEWLKNYPR